MSGFGVESRGVWCQDASPGAVARLARSGFDWVCLDAQHGMYGRAELLETARAFPFDAAELVVRVASCDFAGIGAALDVGATTVIVPQIESAAGSRAGRRGDLLPAARTAKLGSDRADLGAYGDSIGGGQRSDLLRGDDRVGYCAGPGRGDRSSPWSQPAVRRPVRPVAVTRHDRRWTARRRRRSALARISAAAKANDLSVGAYGGNPALAERFREHGISCLVVATDLWLVAEGARAALNPVL